MIVKVVKSAWKALHSGNGIYITSCVRYRNATWTAMHHFTRRHVGGRNNRSGRQIEDDRDCRPGLLDADYMSKEGYTSKLSMHGPCLVTLDLTGEADREGQSTVFRTIQTSMFFLVLSAKVDVKKEFRTARLILWSISCSTVILHKKKNIWIILCEILFKFIVWE
jgi:hypothetical protein